MLCEYGDGFTINIGENLQKTQDENCYQLLTKTKGSISCYLIEEKITYQHKKIIYQHRKDYLYINTKNVFTLL